jgi:hypothetical protein
MEGNGSLTSRQTNLMRSRNWLCEIFGCGRGYARITFRPNTVTWHDFHSVTGDKSVLLGYFTFNRTQYEQARLAFTHSA